MGDGERYIGVGERRARLALRQQLAAGARVGSPEEVADALVALHGSDPATVYLAIGARLTDSARTVAETERALYEDRSLVRMHGMRHTVFAFPTELTAVVHASTGLTVAARERASLLKDMAKAGAPDASWLKEVEESALAALARRGQATADPRDVLAALGPDAIGRTIEATVLRAGTLTTVSVTVGEHPSR